MTSTMSSPAVERFRRLFYRALGGHDAPCSPQRCRRTLQFWEENIATKIPLNGESINATPIVYEAHIVLGYLADDMEFGLRHAMASSGTDMKPRWIAAWPSIWEWVKIIHNEYLAMLSDPAVHVTVTKAVALSIKAILFAFTDYNAEIFAVVANTPGYISMVMSCWTDQAKNFDPSYGFDEYDPWLLLPLLSDPQRTQEINDFCGGTIQFVGMCLDRIITNIGQTVPDHDALRGDLSLFSLSDPLKHPIWPAFLSHTRCIEVIIRVLLYSMQRPKERFPLLVPCLAILSIALSIGGYVFALRVLQTEYLPLLIRAATAYEKSPDIMREQPEMAQNFARSLTNSLSLYLINRTCCSAIRSSLRTPTFRRAASKLDPRGAFAQALGAFEGRVQAWKSVALEYKIRPRTVFKCGNPNCDELDYNEQEKFLRCAGCICPRYCSRSCQKRDWKGHHRVLCRGMQKLTYSDFVTLSTSNLKYLGHVIAREYINNQAHIAQIQADYLKTAQDVDMPPYLKFDYTSIDIDLVIGVGVASEAPGPLRDLLKTAKTAETVFVRVSLLVQGHMRGRYDMLAQLWPPYSGDGGPMTLSEATLSEDPPIFSLRWINMV